jgi:hypothetical protein
VQKAPRPVHREVDLAKPSDLTRTALPTFMPFGCARHAARYPYPCEPIAYVLISHVPPDVLAFFALSDPIRRVYPVEMS